METCVHYVIDSQVFKLARGACFAEGVKVQFVEFQ